MIVTPQHQSLTVTPREFPVASTIAEPQSLTVIPLMCTATGSSRPGLHISAF